MTGIAFTVAQQKGGSGKTMLTAHLAVTWATEYDRNVAILDIDPQGSLGQWFELREQNMGESSTRLTFRTSSGWGARRESRALLRDFDIVVVDTPPHADRSASNAMELSSLIVVPVQPTPADLWATEATIQLAHNERTPSILVLNRVPPRARLTNDIITGLGKIGAPIADARLGNRVSFSECFGMGSSVTEKRSSGVAASEVRALAAELMSKSNTDEPPEMPFAY